MNAFELTKRRLEELQSAFDAIDDARNQQEYDQLVNAMLLMKTGFDDAARKIMSELNTFAFKYKQKSEADIRKSVEGKYFKENDYNCFNITKVGEVIYNPDAQGSKIVLNDCIVSGIWSSPSRTETTCKVGTIYHYSIGLTYLIEITKEEFVNMKDNLLKYHL